MVSGDYSYEFYDPDAYGYPDEEDAAESTMTDQWSFGS